MSFLMIPLQYFQLQDSWCFGFLTVLEAIELKEITKIKVYTYINIKV